MNPLRAVGASVVVGLLFVTASSAAGADPDPGRWQLISERVIPLTYYQGTTSDGAGHFFFNGHVGLYRTDQQLVQQAHNHDVIPPAVHAREGYDHIGDSDYNAREGGRILLPLECYYERASTQVCTTGSIGVADPTTLKWRYYVKLDPAEIPKAMWCEVSPDGTLLWTSSGNDLLAYNVSDINPTNAAPNAKPIKAVRRLVNAVPEAGITGAAFYKGRFYTAGQDGHRFTVSSTDLATGAWRLEIVRDIVGEGEGLDIGPGGWLRWIVMPYNTETIPTYGIHHGELLTFKPIAT
ncbi:MAG: hypothetical protein QOG53_2200 [Frankiales bacterium]|nr:hypothetical protein [Frankiales bacterium]